MTKGSFPLESFQSLETPFYYYDGNLLRRTLETVRTELSKYEGFVMHYAVKANANPSVLRMIALRWMLVFRPKESCMRELVKKTGKSV